MTISFREFARRADTILRSGVCLAQPLIVDGTTAAPKADFHAAEGWGRIRHLQTEPFQPHMDRYSSDEKYRIYLDSLRENKLVSVEALIRSLDLTRYRRIMELGCGDMPQAYIVSSRFSDIHYTATDFDANVIERCSRLSLLGGINKMVFDVTRDDLDELGNHDLVISWSLEFLLSETQLTNLFASCKRNSVPYLLCTHTTIGPIEYLLRILSQAKLKIRVERSRLSLLGWLRSVGEITRLANKAGMRLEWKDYCHYHAMLLFVP